MCDDCDVTRQIVFDLVIYIQKHAIYIYGCTSKFEVRINPQNPQAIQTPDPDLRSRPIQTSRSRPMIQTYDPDLLLHFVWVCWSRPLVLFWSEHVGSCPIPSLMAGLWPWRTCCPAACCSEPALSSSSVGTFWIPSRYQDLEQICLSRSRPRSTPFQTCSRPFQIFSRPFHGIELDGGRV